MYFVLFNIKLSCIIYLRGLYMWYIRVLFSLYDQLFELMYWMKFGIRGAVHVHHTTSRYGVKRHGLFLQYRTGLDISVYFILNMD